MQVVVLHAIRVLARLLAAIKRRHPNTRVETCLGTPSCFDRTLVIRQAGANGSICSRLIQEK